VTIPANSTATVVVPADDLQTVMESGHPAAQGEGVRFLGLGQDSATYQIGSGTYHFGSVYKE
jgi:alpha-L-rhamnosidase